MKPIIASAGLKAVGRIETNSALQFSVVLAVLLFNQTGRADGLDNWTSRNPVPTDVTLSGITYGNGQFVTVGGNGTILISSNGISWLQRDLENTVGLSVVGYGSGRFVALSGAHQGSVAATSADGVTWAQSGPVFNDFGAFSLAYGNSRFVAVGQETGPVAILASLDGVNWEPSAHNLGTVLSGMTYGNGRFVAVGLFFDTNGFPENGGISTSLDGTNWLAHPSGPPNQLYGITYGKGQYVAVGDAGTILTSADGVNWVTRQSGTQNTLNDVAYGNGVFVAVSGLGDTLLPEIPVIGAILTSEDGVNWIQRLTATTNAFNRIAYGNGRFVAVGHDGTILTSGPIIDLTLTPTAGTGPLRLSLEGPTGLGYTIQTSTDLIAWQTVTNITSVQPTTVILDALPFASQRFYYRAYAQ